MKRLITHIFFALALAVTGSVTLHAQQPKPSPTPPPSADADPGDGGIERVNTRIVKLPITVVDKKGAPVGGLTASDFQVFEDKRAQQVASFSSDAQKTPLYIGVLMDTSSSTAGKLKFEQEAAKNFIYTVTRVRKDKVAFVTFDDEVKLRQDFTDKLDLLDRAIDNVKKPDGHTALYDAVWQFCDEKMRGVTGTRVLLVITDGEDTYSRAQLRDAIDIAQATETAVFVISTKGGFAGSTVPGVQGGTVSSGTDRDLEKLCAETGGRTFFTGDLLALERSLTKIAQELRAQYVVTYRPDNRAYDNSYRRIEVRLANERDGMKVRTRRGYTARPVGYTSRPGSNTPRK